MTGFRLWINPSREVMRMEHHDGISALIRKDGRKPLLLSLPCEDICDKAAVCSQEESLTRT